MPGDTHDDEMAAHAPHNDDDTFNPTRTPDRFRRRVRDDHAPNAALHSALRAVTEDDERASVNLMGSHAPGEKPQEPRYHVRLSLENAAGGQPSTGETIVDNMVARDDVVITKAYGGARFDDVTVHDDTWRGDDPTPPDDIIDAVESTMKQSVDRLTVHLRPVETRVEPVEVRYDDLPTGVVGKDSVRDTLVAFADRLRCQFDDVETADEAAKRLSEFARDTFGDGFDDWDGPADERTEDAAEVLRDVRHDAIEDAVGAEEAAKRIAESIRDNFNEAVPGDHAEDETGDEVPKHGAYADNLKDSKPGAATGRGSRE